MSEQPTFVYVLLDSSGSMVTAAFSDMDQSPIIGWKTLHGKPINTVLRYRFDRDVTPLPPAKRRRKK